MKNLLFALVFFTSSLMAQSPITIHLEKNLERVGDAAARIVSEEIDIANREKKQLTLILPTGSTPINMYKSLVKEFYEGKLDFSKVTFFNLDEYVGLGPEDENSYAYYMANNFYNFITPEITIEKLRFFGLCPLTKKNCFNNKNRDKLNESLEQFCAEIIEVSGENPNTIEAFEKCVQSFKKNNRGFLKLYTEYMDDHSLPSIASLKACLEKDISLRSLAAHKRNIHLIDGLANIEDEIYRYQKQLKYYLDLPNSRTICFAGIGRGPAHIAFNEFITEDIFLGDELTEEEKNKKALKSQMRLVPLAQGTKESNARFFAGNVSSVPHQALTLGLKEIFDCSKIVVLASGEEKREALYDVFSKNSTYKVPASLLKKYNKGQLEFIIDEKAYGLAEQKSLFALRALNSFEDKSTKITLCTNRSEKLPFWHIPGSSQPALLDKGYKLKHDTVTLASTPKKQTVLWVKEGKIHYSLWQELKENQNKVHVTHKQDIDTLLTQIDKHKPDIIILPYTLSMIENFSKLKTEIANRYSGRPILGIFYETTQLLSTVFLPLSREEQNQKVEVVKKFHHTQALRGKFHLIADEMSTITTPFSTYNEAFSFFNLKNENNKLKLIPFDKKHFITKDYEKSKKYGKHPPFSFDKTDIVTIISPHPDDAEIGLGGLISHLGKEKVKTCVLNATTGHKAVIKKEFVLSHPYLPNDILQQAKCENSEFIGSKILKSRIRECESLGALSYLNDQIIIKNLRLPFYDHAKNKLTPQDRSEVDLALVRATKGEAQRLFFFLPYPQDSQSTHRKVYQLFIERISRFYKKNPEYDVIIAFYPTPWTGKWNVYDYSYNQGSKLAALAGGELLIGAGLTPAKPETLGGIFAKRYQLFYFNN